MAKATKKKVVEDTIKDKKQAIAKYQKEYYEKNKERIKEGSSKLVECKCGMFITSINYNRHLRSPRHVRIIEFLKNN